MARYRDARGRFIKASTHRRSQAAARAWFVRKATARKRSDAARKGWNTRRARARAAAFVKRISTRDAPARDVPQTVESLSEYADLYDDTDDTYDEFEVETSPDYGEAD